MAHFAQIDSDSIVTNVIVVSNEDCLDSDGNESEAVGIAFCQNLLGAGTNWVQTSYNDNIRCRYASINSKYDSTNDVFYEPQPYPSWGLNTSTWAWDAPVALPDDAGLDDEDNPTEHVIYDWDEGSISWARSVHAVASRSNPDADDFPYATRGLPK
tara:strand:+ start:1083 stop:1550 length:468 start_codon:yes stop_codon:yes gene_type:complete